MNTPRFLLAAAILFWGWQTGHWLIAAGTALVLEGARFVGPRVQLTIQHYRHVADFCSVMCALAVIYFYFAVGVPQAVILLFRWLPLMLLPLAIAQAYGASPQLDLSVVVWALRRREQPQDQFNFGYPCFALWLVAASAANNRDPGFYLGVTLLVIWALWHVRPAAYPVIGWAGCCAGAALIGFGAHIGLHQTQLWLEGAVPDWLAGSGTRTDPYDNRTDIGTIGELKQSDAIVLRVTARDLAQPLLLHRASYNDYVGITWVARNAPLTPQAMEEGEKIWRLLPDTTATARIEVSEHAPHGNPVLSLPKGTIEVSGLAASALKRNFLGTVQAEDAPGYIDYAAQFDPQASLDGAPTGDDLKIPRAEQATLQHIAAGIELAPGDAQAAVAEVKQHFATGFQYSTYRKSEASAVSPLAEFLLQTKAGHCEHFATATALLLRTAGVPARYATGFSVHEFSTLENAYVVRARHAHAWVTAYVNGAWIDIDTTPPNWISIERGLASGWTPLFDLWSWLRFRFASLINVTGSNQLGLTAGVLAALMIGWVAWRIYRNRHALRVARPSRPDSAPQMSRAGTDSDFFAVERHLAGRGLGRRDSETMLEWLDRIGDRLPAAKDTGALRTLALLHYRYRFDPAGLDGEQRTRLRIAAREWLEQYQQRTAAARPAGSAR